LKRKILSQPFFYIGVVGFALCWLALFHYGGTIYSSRQEIAIWDPFDLLGVRRYSSMADIKRQYKRKSLEYHPDKRRNGISKEASEERFLEITKAYKAYFPVVSC
jgi:translocation protein SEC63